jgi:membrane protease YdiL (CAAX protease family)
MGVDSPALFIALGVFYALGHSLLEEYYWRWFVFGRLREWVAVPWAIAISSLGFMAHHVVLMATFFGLFSFWACFFSLSVAVGGLFWAWSYQRTGSLYGPWLGHLLVDAGIFIVGYDLVF